MLQGLDLLEKDFSKKDEPSFIDMVMFMFWEKGMTIEKLPIPYILSIVRTFHYTKELERKEIEKAKRRK